MSPLERGSIWFSRLVLAAATLLLIRISTSYIADPVAATAPHQITLGSAEALTILRVTGSVFLAIAIALGACLVSERRLLVGVTLLSIFATVVTAVRLLGLVLDGPAPFTLHVLKPEIALVVLSSAAMLLERHRRRERRATLKPGPTSIATERT